MDKIIISRQILVSVVLKGLFWQQVWFWQDNIIRDSTFDFECQLHFWLKSLVCAFTIFYSRSDMRLCILFVRTILTLGALLRGLISQFRGLNVNLSHLHWLVRTCGEKCKSPPLNKRERSDSQFDCTAAKRLVKYQSTRILNKIDESNTFFLLLNFHL